MKFRALIADDEPTLGQYLASRLGELWPDLDILDIAVNGIDALGKIENMQPDIVFLDIKMPGMSGLDVAKNMNHPCLVVFVTAYNQYAVKAFEEEAVDYLLKPVSEERLLRAIDRIKKRLDAKDRDQDLKRLLTKLNHLVEESTSHVRYLRASSGKGIRLIAVEDILFIQARSKYTAVVTKDGEYLMRIPLAELIGRLDPNQFWQVHRSIIVNASKVVSASRIEREKYALTIKDWKDALPVSRSFVHLFRLM